MGRPFFRPAHRDDSEPAIIKALRAVGASVWPISGKDVPDLLVGYRGQTFVLEVKTRGKSYTDKRNGKTYKKDGALTTGQKAFFESWKGGPVREVFTPEEALYAIGAPVEGVLEPLPPKPPPCACNHPASAHNKTAGYCMVGSCECLGPDVTSILRDEGRLVTPTYQREQTAAVVPKKKR